MNTIVLTPTEWDSIREKIAGHHGRNILLISWRCKRELGFTVRTHTEWIPETEKNHFLSDIELGVYQTNKKLTTIRLDFCDAQAETMFRLRYL
jgi:hypothetical protein